MVRIGIIGAGVFGIGAALELAKDPNNQVFIYESSDKIIGEASTINHLRHHHGFHYPRSEDTTLEILKGMISFEEEFGECVERDMDSYYAIAKEGSKTSPEDYIKFCNKFGLDYKIVHPDPNIINPSKIDLCIKTKEPVYNPIKLVELMLKKIKERGIKLNLNSPIVGGDVNSRDKYLLIRSGDETSKEFFDIIVNATYININNVNKLIKGPQKKYQYELMEMIELKLPIPQRIALTIMDGEFCSIMPRPNGTHALAQVNTSVLKRTVADFLEDDHTPKGDFKSNLEESMRLGIESFPFLKDAEIIGPLHVTKITQAHVDHTDERLTEIMDYGNNFYSIFGGKVLTCLEFGKKLSEIISKQNKKY
jgi:hypothetical protein